MKLPEVFRTKRRAKITQIGSVVLKMSAVKRSGLGVLGHSVYSVNGSSVAIEAFAKGMRLHCIV